MIPKEFTKVESKIKKFYRKGAEYIGTFNIEAKRCKTCREYKHLEHFVKIRERKDGLGYIYQPYCKECDGLRNRIWRQKKLKSDPDYNKIRCKAGREKRGLWYGRLDKLCYTTFGRSFKKLTKNEQCSIIIRRLTRLKKKNLLSDSHLKELFESLDKFNKTPRVQISKSYLEEIFSTKLQ